MQASAGEPRGITALLGPTNTGKTHHALERMLDHATGMIGLPLRLLAREVYDRLTTRVGEKHVALVTGEEKRIPPHPRYFVCTVEAMPTDREVDFLAVDEIQLCAHPERGHVFTDRLLNARGRVETWFLGSETIRPLLEYYVPTARITSRPRLSVLRGVPPMNLGRLPPRSAIVAFSTDRVYDIAAQLRQRRGGAAIVLGALSPRTRNAQVALYQSGEVDYMVATDAIGMGLNLSIDHIAFAGMSKFDGREERPLEIAELAQIAGRAGRYLNQGTFGTLSPLPAFAPSIVRAIEAHRFPPEAQLWWRNSALDFESPKALLESLKHAPQGRGLRLMSTASDQMALMMLIQKPPVQRYLNQKEAVELLWEICKIPDYRQLWFELHVQFLENIFLQLMGSRGQIDPDFISQRLSAIDDTRGDIQVLMDRIADIRTWTYVATHPTWVHSAKALKDRSMSIEDRLSDALHERLVSQFVERSKTFGVRASRPIPAIGSKRSSPFLVLLEQFADKSSHDENQVKDDWIESIVNAAHEQLSADVRGWIQFDGKRIARFEAGPDLLHPNVRLAQNLDPGPGARSQLTRRLVAYGRDLAESVIAPIRARSAAQLSPAGRGVVYQLEQALGTIRVEQAREQISLLTPRDRELLTSFGVHLGARLIYLRRSLTPAALASRAALASVKEPLNEILARIELGAPSISIGTPTVAVSMLYFGYVQMGSLAIRADQFEITWREVGRLDHSGRITIPDATVERLACTREELERSFAALGFYASAKKRRHRQRSRRQGYSEAQGPAYSGTARRSSG